MISRIADCLHLPVAVHHRGRHRDRLQPDHPGPPCGCARYRPRSVPSGHPGPAPAPPGTQVSGADDGHARSAQQAHGSLPGGAAPEAEETNAALPDWPGSEARPSGNIRTKSPVRGRCDMIRGLCHSAAKACSVCRTSCTSSSSPALYLSGRADVDHYLEVMNKLSGQALTPARSARFLADITREA
jgi:hypothetical protein